MARRFMFTSPLRPSYASTGIGGTPHLTAELFKRAADIRILHVPYRGMPPALVDLLSGQVTMMFANLGDALPHIKAGKVKALAVVSCQGTLLHRSVLSHPWLLRLSARSMTSEFSTVYGPLGSMFIVFLIHTHLRSCYFALMRRHPGSR